ncbi:flagellar hook-length control protein FliK [Loktanella sp. TSTF-M6]|uniref:Flagellar hook-length control protein FliK n=1 Tax=Loktanella gaetbuli TaxID=2881335 RepID=A0ABS8BUE0_9RHOB|nr:flagellar hook-length control protein FliK [Loktanella gaetbuli]MCB5199358.1 flagellar hook-length control protein FliK [Loktanella gaetbuli]
MQIALGPGMTRGQVLFDVVSPSDVTVPSAPFDEFLTGDVGVWQMPDQEKAAGGEAGDENESAHLVDIIDAGASGPLPQAILPIPTDPMVLMHMPQNERAVKAVVASSSWPAATETEDMPFLTGTDGPGVRVDAHRGFRAAEGMTAQQIDTDGNLTVVSPVKEIGAPNAKSQESPGQPVSTLTDTTTAKLDVSDKANDQFVRGDTQKSALFQSIDQIIPAATTISPAAIAVTNPVVGFATAPRTSMPRTDLQLRQDDQTAVSLHTANTVPVMPPLGGAVSDDMTVGLSAIDKQAFRRTLEGQRQGAVEIQATPVSDPHDKSSIFGGITSMMRPDRDSVDLLRSVHAGLTSDSGARSDLMTPFAPLGLGSGDLQAERVPRSTVASPVAGSVAQQIAVTINQATEGTVELALNPAELGRVRMTLTAQDHGMAIHVLTERPETADLMRRHVDGLQQELRALGYTSVTLDFDAGGATRDRAKGQPEPSQNANEIGTVSTGEQPIQPQPVALRTGGLDLRL